MPTFAYKALAGDGRKANGMIEAASDAAAIAAVQALGLTPLQVQAKANAKGGAMPKAAAAGGPAKAGGRVKSRQIHAFFRQLAGLLAAGVPMSRALNILNRETSSPAAKALWEDIHDEVADGSTLADAMKKQSGTFPEVQVAMVRAGETGGFLDAVLRQIADFMTRERELKSRVMGAMIYPAILAVVATGVVTFLLTWFIPKFSEIFSEYGQSLPWITRVVQGASFLVRDYGLFVFIALVVGVIFLRRAVQSEKGQRLRDEAMVKLPLIGPASSAFALVRFCRMFGTLLGAGVPLIEAIQTARQAIDNQVLSDALDQSIESVRRGGALAEGLSTCPELFPPSVLEVLAVAEETGNLPEELVRLAEEREQDLDSRLRTLVSLAEPAMLFIMAALVGTILVGMLLPVFDLWDVVE